MSGIEAISGSEVPEIQEEERISKIDFEIYSEARPKICTAFEGVELKSKGIIILSDGSLWKTSQADISIANHWQKGDDIRIKGKKGKTVILKNVRTGEALTARSSKKCADLSKAVFIEKVDRSGYGILTSDGKIWVTGYLGACTAQYWKPNHRVVINQSSHSKRDYEIINPHNGSSVWVTQVFHNYALTKKTSDQVVSS